MISELKRLKGPFAAGRPSMMPAVIALVFISLVAATVIAALAVRSNNEATSQRNLADAVDVAIASSVEDLRQGISQLQGIQGLFNASETVTREEFGVFVGRFLAETEGIQALEWIPRVRASQKERFIDNVRKEGFEDFNIHPATEAQDLFPVTYLEPRAGNTAAFGFDLYSEDVRRAALIQAWESGKLAITEPITLVQETGSQSAFLVYAPIYSSKDIPATLQERRDLLEGFGLSIIRFGDFINAAVPASFDPSIDIIVIDAHDTEHEVVLFTTLEPGVLTSEFQGAHVLRSVAVADQNWIFHFMAPPGFGVNGFERTAWILVLALGLLFSVIILAIVLLLYKGRQAALDLSVERQQSEEAQRTLADDLTQLIETAKNPVFGVTTNGTVNIWNQAIADITGVPKEDAVGHIASEFMTDESQIQAARHLRLVLSDEPCANFNVQFLAAGSEPSDLLLSCSARRDADGAITGVFVVGLDISERLRAEREIRTLNSSLENRVADRTRELQEALDELESFSYSVSHDLRGPLRSINGFSLAVLERSGDKLDDEGRSYLERVRNATNRMGGLIDDLLGLSRVGRAEVISEPLDLGKMVQEQAEELKAADSKREVEFIIPDDMTGFGDERLIGIVMDNLVRNAWKFSSKHSRARIEIGKQEQNGETVYFVKDDGAGFDMAYADKLFLPFQRLHPTGEFEGTGIGLATVKRIIQRHGGKIWAEGAVEKGATVYFTLGNQADRKHE